MFFDISFWQNLVAGAIATLIGVIIGIPVALWLNNKFEKTRKVEDDKHKNQLLKEEKRRYLIHYMMKLTTTFNYWNR